MCLEADRISASCVAVKLLLLGTGAVSGCEMLSGRGGCAELPSMEMDVADMGSACIEPSRNIASSLPASRRCRVEELCSGDKKLLFDVGAGEENVFVPIKLPPLSISLLCALSMPDSVLQNRTVWNGEGRFVFA